MILQKAFIFISEKYVNIFHIFTNAIVSILGAYLWYYSYIVWHDETQI